MQSVAAHGPDVNTQLYFCKDLILQQTPSDRRSLVITDLTGNQTQGRSGCFDIVLDSDRAKGTPEVIPN